MAVLGEQPLRLTPVEFDLLLCLARAKGRVNTREALLDEIRDRHYEVFDRSVDVHVSALRKKLGDDPKTPQVADLSGKQSCASSLRLMGLSSPCF